MRVVVFFECNSLSLGVLFVFPIRMYFLLFTSHTWHVFALAQSNTDEIPTKESSFQFYLFHSPIFPVRKGNTPICYPFSSVNENLELFILDI